MGQGGGVLAGDEDAPDHEVELDGVEDAVAIVGLLGDRGKRLWLFSVGVAGAARTACRTAARTAGSGCEFR